MTKDRYLGRHATRWPDPIKGPWLIRFHWAEVGDRVECVGLDVRSFQFKGEAEESASPMPGGYQPVTTSMVRSLKADSLIEENREGFQGMVAAAATRASMGAKGRREAARALKAMETPRRTGRPTKYGPEHYLRVAEVYAQAHAANRTPRRAVAREFDVPDTTAGHWITKARALGFLGEPPGRGRAGGTIPQPKEGKP